MVNLVPWLIMSSQENRDRDMAPQLPLEEILRENLKRGNDHKTPSRTVFDRKYH